MERKYKCFISEKSLYNYLQQEFPNTQPIIDILQSYGVYIHTILKKIAEYEGAIPVYDFNITLLADLMFIIDDFNLTFSCIEELVNSLDNMIEVCKSTRHYNNSIYTYMCYLVSHLKTKYILPE